MSATGTFHAVTVLAPNFSCLSRSFPDKQSLLNAGKLVSDAHDAMTRSSAASTATAIFLY
jgi:hypothetical protein